MRKHRALVDRALVGHLPRVEGGGIVHQNEAREASRAAPGGFVERAEQARESRPHALAGENLRRGGAVAEPRQFAAGREIGHDERRRVVAIMPSDDDVRYKGRAMGDELDPERPDADPGAGRKLEVFGYPAVEQEAALRLAFVGEAQSVAELVVALFVEGRLGELRLAPVARGDAGAFQARFELLAVGHELHLDARIGNADNAGLAGARGHTDRRGAGFGRAERSQDGDGFADRLAPEPLEFLAHVRRQRRAGVDEGLEASEQVLAQRFVRLEIGQQHLEALGHVVVNGRRHLE